MKNLSTKLNRENDVRGYSCDNFCTGVCSYSCASGCDGRCTVECANSCNNGCTSRNGFDPIP